MKKLLYIFSLTMLMGLISCSDRDGHGGNDDMYNNTNQNGAGDATGNDAATASPNSDTINLSDDTIKVLDNDSTNRNR